MIVISDFTELNINPRSGGISAADFGASKFCSHIDVASKLVAVWSDDNSGEELNFKIYDFDRELKFSLREPIIYSKFEPRAAQIRLARRDGDQQISILIYDYNGGLKSNLALPDELRNSGVWMDELPQIGGMAVGLGAGQDGSRSFLLHADGSGLNLTAELEEGFSFLFATEGKGGENDELEQKCAQDHECKDEQNSELKPRQKRMQEPKQERENNQKCERASEAVLLNFYEGQIAIVSYPELKPLRKFSFPDELTLDGETREFMLGGIVPLSDKIWLVRDDGYFRHYLFDAIEFEFIAEIALAGFEPKIDGAGEITSQICDIDYRKGKLIFTHYELAGEGEQTREINRYFEADATALGQILTDRLKIAISGNIYKILISSHISKAAPTLAYKSTLTLKTQT